MTTNQQNMTNIHQNITNNQQNMTNNQQSMTNNQQSMTISQQSMTVSQQNMVDFNLSINQNKIDNDEFSEYTDAYNSKTVVEAGSKIFMLKSNYYLGSADVTNADKKLSSSKSNNLINFDLLDNNFSSVQQSQKPESVKINNSNTEKFSEEFEDFQFNAVEAPKTSVNKNKMTKPSVYDLNFDGNFFK